MEINGTAKEKKAEIKNQRERKRAKVYEKQGSEDSQKAKAKI